MSKLTRFLIPQTYKNLFITDNFLNLSVSGVEALEKFLQKMLGLFFQASLRGLCLSSAEVRSLIYGPDFLHTPWVEVGSSAHMARCCTS